MHLGFIVSIASHRNRAVLLSKARNNLNYIVLIMILTSFSRLKTVISWK